MSRTNKEIRPIMDWGYIQKKMTKGMPDLDLKKYHIFRNFLVNIFEFRELKERANTLKDMDFSYSKHTDEINLTISFEQHESLPEFKMDFARCYTSQYNEVTKSTCRKDKYAVNMRFSFEELLEISKKLQNLHRSNKTIEKFNL
jgi:hypothetical protein